MGNRKEQQPTYLPVSNQKIIEGLEGISDEQLSKLGISEGLLFMIRQGFGNQLREDVFKILSLALNLDISAADTSFPKQNPPQG